jgi:hypothetical protein
VPIKIPIDYLNEGMGKSQIKEAVKVLRGNTD